MVGQENPDWGEKECLDTLTSSEDVSENNTWLRGLTFDTTSPNV